jgi:hypothetical protein
MDFSKYQNKVPRPKKPGRPTIDSRTPSKTELDRYAQELSEFEKKEITYQTEVEKSQDEDSRLFDLFKKDLFEELGIKNHSKKEKIFSYAWEKAYSSGFNEVFCVAENLVKALFSDETCC